MNKFNISIDVEAGVLYDAVRAAADVVKYLGLPATSVYINTIDEPTQEAFDAEVAAKAANPDQIVMNLYAIPTEGTKMPGYEFVQDDDGNHTPQQPDETLMQDEDYDNSGAPHAVDEDGWCTDCDGPKPEQVVNVADHQDEKPAEDPFISEPESNPEEPITTVTPDEPVPAEVPAQDDKVDIGFEAVQDNGQPVAPEGWFWNIDDQGRKYLDTTKTAEDLAAEKVEPLSLPYTTDDEPRQPDTEEPSTPGILYPEDKPLPVDEVEAMALKETKVDDVQETIAQADDELTGVVDTIEPKPNTGPIVTFDVPEEPEVEEKAVPVWTDSIFLEGQPDPIPTPVPDSHAVDVAASIAEAEAVDDALRVQQVRRSNFQFPGRGE